MGRKLLAREKKLAKGPRGEITAHLRKLLGDRTPAEIAVLLDCSEGLARKYLAGDRIPAVENWPRIAKALGLSNWRELIPPKK